MAKSQILQAIKSTERAAIMARWSPSLPNGFHALHAANLLKQIMGDLGIVWKSTIDHHPLYGRAMHAINDVMAAHRAIK